MPRRGKQGIVKEPSTKRPRRNEQQNEPEPVKVRKPQRTWSSQETTKILEYLKESVSSGFEIEVMYLHIICNHEIMNYESY